MKQNETSRWCSKFHFKRSPQSRSLRSFTLDSLWISRALTHKLFLIFSGYPNHKKLFHSKAPRKQIKFRFFTIGKTQTKLFENCKIFGEKCVNALWFRHPLYAKTKWREKKRSAHRLSRDKEPKYRSINLSLSARARHGGVMPLSLSKQKKQ